ncbi:hypothetical protein OGV36_07810 [Citrobacter sp. Cb008]|uniref:hypothetical protein n=1 Tax=Citrobacter TaxID=544 RepID=UPI0003313A3D|nr:MULTISPECIES: hypothetical protein [Citrobacter]EFH5542028.1 hypothetical protein [Escherichia coli]EJW6839662.1 hypothetical protein [Escherichia coli]ELK1052570.1 hypothetical protein [Escherichia coli]EOQ31630.1 hypothetical protein WEU_01584 [Citrobacter sp. KTE32]MBS8930126.1 hypothetical protein [Escherichia coli]
MDLIANITDEPIQRHILIFDRGEAVVTIRYLPTVEMWKMRVEYNDDYIDGVKLSLATLHFRHKNWPFDIMTKATDGNGIDPYRADDFASGRIEMYLVTPEEMIDIRGGDVP